MLSLSGAGDERGLVEKKDWPRARNGRKIWRKPYQFSRTVFELPNSPENWSKLKFMNDKFFSNTNNSSNLNKGGHDCDSVQISDLDYSIDIYDFNSPFYP